MPISIGAVAIGRRALLVLGIGNLLMGDEGVGVHAVRALENEELPPDARLMDGGTGGFHLLSAFREEPEIIITVEVVTDGETELAIDHTLREAPPGARLTQRWLLPMAIAEFHGVATSLVQSGDDVHVIGADRLVTLSTLTGRTGRAADALPPSSLTLADGKVAAIHGNALVIAVPHGGSAARSVTTRGERRSRG